MPGKEHPNSTLTRSCENFEDLSRNLVSILDLTQDAYLHVVDEQSDALATTDFLKSLRNIESKGVFHTLSQNVALTLRNILVDQSLKTRIIAQRVPHRVELKNGDSETAWYLEQMIE